MLCPRRKEVGAGPGSPFVLANATDDRDPQTGNCRWCGSMSEEEFFRLVEEGKLIEPTDKDYKAYIGTRKFYFQHLSEAGITRFIETYNARKMNVNTPGHFYVLPFFCKRVTAG